MSADFEHVVGATAIPEIAFFVLVIFVSGGNPMALKYVFALLVLVPITGGCAIATDKQAADLTYGYVLPLFIDEAGLIARNYFARTARADFTFAITDEGLQHFGTADAVEDGDVKLLLKAIKKIGGQGFSS